MTENASNAQVIRALTRDYHIRFSSLFGSPLWDGVRRGHPQLDGQACSILVELLMGAALLQSRTVYAERLQLLLKSSGQVQDAVADVWPDGDVRGVLDLRPESHSLPLLTPPGLVQVMRSNPKGSPYIGSFELTEGGIGTQLEVYLQQSEQIQASVILWCHPETGEAGGILAEPLPNCPQERLARLVQALENLEVVPLWERTNAFLMEWISQGFGADVMSVHDLAYRCRCSKEALVELLKSFQAEQKAELFHDQEDVEVRCEYCHQAYRILAREC